MSNPTFVADELVTAAKMNLLPKGILDYAERTTDQTGITSLVDLTGLAVTVTVVAGRSIRITGQVLFTGGSATSILAIREGSTQLHTGNMLTPGPATEVVHVQRILIPSAGSHTYKLSAQASGTATAVTAAATHPAFILVEDLGVL